MKNLLIVLSLAFSLLFNVQTAQALDASKISTNAKIISALIYSFFTIDPDFAFMVDCAGVMFLFLLYFILLFLPNLCCGIKGLNKQVQDWVARNYNNQLYATFLTYFNPLAAKKYAQTQQYRTY